MGKWFERLRTDRFVQLILILVVVSLVFFFILVKTSGSRPRGGQPGQPGQGGETVPCYRQRLTLWSPFNPSSFNQLIKALQRYCLTLNVQQKELNVIKTELLGSLVKADAPDIVYLDQLYLVENSDIFEKFPETFKLQTNDYPKDISAFVEQRKIGYPVTADTLVTFWNTDLINSFGLTQPPLTFEELEQLIPTARRIEAGQIKFTPVALGAANNIEAFYEIFMAILKMQSGGELSRFQFSQPFFAALDYYTRFADPNSPVYTWNDRLERDLESFASQKVALIFNFYSNKERLSKLNPRLTIGVAPLPKFAAKPLKSNYLRAFYLAVPKGKTERSKLAWLVLAELDKDYRVFIEQARIMPIKLSLSAQLPTEAKVAFTEFLVGESFVEFDQAFMKTSLSEDLPKWLINKDETRYLIQVNRLNKFFK